MLVRQLSRFAFGSPALVQRFSFAMDGLAAIPLDVADRDTKDARRMPRQTAL